MPASAAPRSLSRNGAPASGPSPQRPRRLLARAVEQVADHGVQRPRGLDAARSPRRAARAPSPRRSAPAPRGRSGRACARSVTPVRTLRVGDPAICRPGLGAAVALDRRPARERRRGRGQPAVDAQDARRKTRANGSSGSRATAGAAGDRDRALEVRGVAEQRRDRVGCELGEHPAAGVLDRDVVEREPCAPRGGRTSEIQAGSPAGSTIRASIRRAPRVGRARRCHAASQPAGRPSGSVTAACAVASAAGASSRSSQHQLMPSAPPSRCGSSG